MNREADELRFLMDSQPPRSREAADRAVAGPVDRAERFARRAVRCTAVLTGVMCALLGSILVACSSPTEIADGGIPTAFLMLWLGVGMPVAAVHWAVTREGKALRRLARIGTLHRATTYRPALSTFYYGIVWLTWEEDGRQVKACVAAARTIGAPLSADEIFVIARKRDSFVLALLGSKGVFVGKRVGIFGTLN